MRRAGILLHTTSLPPQGGPIESAVRFIDWLADSGCGLWQILPINPPSPEGSPYDSPSCTALDPRLADASVTPSPSECDAFAAAQPWVRDWALFDAVRRHLGVRGWWDFPAELQARDPDHIDAWADRLSREVNEAIRTQVIADTSWRTVRSHARKRGVRIIGDLPIFVARDGVDTWIHPSLFCLDEHGRPDPTTGVPPDAFSDSGQWWNNPHYRWPEHSKTGFSWWIERFRSAMNRHDTVRIDHFRGLCAAWAIPADARGDARTGAWVRAPGSALLRATQTAVPHLHAIAEDLGIITADVVALRQQCGWPGMKVLQFGFESDDSEHCPPFVGTDWVAYTGTHDNDTTNGWYAAADEATQERLRKRVGSASVTRPAEALMELAWESGATWAIAPLADAMNLGSEARMNVPGVKDGNWSWVAPQLPDPGKLLSLNERTLRSAKEV